MSRIVLHPTDTAHWHSLVCEAESAAQHFLDEELQSYLVFLLMRFVGKPEIASSIVALDYIHSLQAHGNSQQDKLRNVGDICLLHAGLFPERASRRRVSKKYYIEMGCSAYQCLADVIHQKLSDLYNRLSGEFLPLTRILHQVREVGGQPIDEQFRTPLAIATTEPEADNLNRIKMVSKH